MNSLILLVYIRLQVPILGVKIQREPLSGAHILYIKVWVSGIIDLSFVEIYISFGEVQLNLACIEIQAHLAGP